MTEGPNQCAHWCLTIWHDDLLHPIRLSELGRARSKAGIWQYERAERTGRIHVQAYIELKRSYKRGASSGGFHLYTMLA